MIDYSDKMRKIFASMLLLAVVADARSGRSKTKRQLTNEIERELNGEAHYVLEGIDEVGEKGTLTSEKAPPLGMRTGRKGVPSDFIADFEDEEHEAFIRWASAFGKDYKKSADFLEKKQVWIQTNRKIKDINDRAEASGNPEALVLEHNHLSDFTKE